ncbi:hypothetical protein SGLAM104S_08661 [Streptomyces glaucescens]
MSETSPKLRAELEGIPTYKPGKPAAVGRPGGLQAVRPT